MLYQDRDVIKDVKANPSETQSDSAIEAEFRSKFASKNPLKRLWALYKTWNKINEYTTINANDFKSMD